MKENIYNLSPMPPTYRAHLSITIDRVVAYQLDQLCKVSGMNKSRAVEAILYNYFKPVLSDAEEVCGYEEDNT